MINRSECYLLIVLAALVLNTAACSQNQTCLGDVGDGDELEAIHLRQKRWLTMIPNGGVCKCVFSSVAPVRWAHKVVRSVNLAVNVQANYAIPAKIIWPHAENFFKERVLSADYVDNSRRDLYQLLERMIKSWGGDGRECLLKTICQTAGTPLHHNGMIGEILDLVFTPSDDEVVDSDYKLAWSYGANGVDCERLYKKCPLEHEMLGKFSKLVDL
ncbi:uncharacterized protein LOC120421217 [Culex pipiens pallens]|uniref:uncharacterized protein LOC120421217 n=1 Tax=Culex pipiens pallens TaxID=42434 RepID=UPI001953F2B7|nr:uncharacterized protein LOC120421217 [Culex pipiens pallens]